MSLNYSDEGIAETFKSLVSSASAVLIAERERENQLLENSFIELIDRAKLLLKGQLEKTTSDLRHQFQTFIEEAQLGLREEQRSEFEECSKFLKTAKSALHRDIMRKVSQLDDILKIEKPAYEKVNIFSILHLSRNEDPQSYFLAWLLNPNNPHGFEDKILQVFLRKCCDIVDDVDYENLNTTNVTITSQQGIDAVGVPDIEMVGDNFICVIENKVGAGETYKDGIGQTQRYAEHYTTQAKKEGKSRLLLYLVPPSRDVGEEAKQPSDKRFKQILYSDIVEVIESVLRTSSPSPEVSCLVEMFLHNIKREICHEFDEYFEAKELLRAGSTTTGEPLYDPKFFASPDKYESLRRLTVKLSREVIENE